MSQINLWDHKNNYQVSNNMSNFILAMVSVVYTLVGLTKESDQGMFSMTKPAEDSSKKGTKEKLSNTITNNE